MTPDTSTVIAVVASLCAIVFGFLAFRRNQKQDDSASAATLATMQTDIKYIREKMDELTDDTAEHGAKIHALEIKQTEIEASVKSAHKRIDTIEQKVS